ncbi:MAG: alpha/beta hydrolase [Butyrivibrio sp.]|uniref:alpha/beta hydrolase n=1 Tax=Butyrivibrio sp. TaxID=28121 RepID=UPI0025D65D3A|nr:alpha/beta hydrolase [Butyrivibrio sp.]MCR5770203.1 alpha/beta hydrolase [Butyrivibrio sp.]
MKLAVIFPGIGYTNQKPLLYYSQKLAKTHGFDVIALDYTDFPSNVRGDESKMKECFDLAWKQTCEQLSKVDFDKYTGDDDCIFFFSKSIGTIMAAKYALENNILAGQIYYTPLEETFKYVQDGYGLAFHGTNDPWANTSAIEQLAMENHIELIEIPDVNHSLELTDSVVDDIDYVADVIETVESYISDYE